VYVGYGIERGSYSDYKGLNLQGKVAVMISRIPETHCALPDSLIALYKGGRRSNQRLASAAGYGAVAVIRIADAWTEKYWKTFGDVLMDNRLRALSSQNQSETENTRLTVTAPVARALFTGQTMPLDSAGTVPPYHPAPLNDISVRYLPGKQSGLIHSPNIVGVVYGSDPVLRNEYIVVGGHLDHVGIHNGEICNGADDNASGVASMLEVAEAVVKNPPKRSVYFVAFTAEELGLLGAKYFVQHSPIPIEKIKFMINLDMMARTRSESDSARSHIVYYSNEGDGAVKETIAGVNEKTVNWALDLRRESGGRSDHAPFISANVPATFFYSGGHKDYHRATDDADLCDYEKLHALTKLVYALVMETGNKAGPLFE
jgi:hypothetical protein